MVHGAKRRSSSFNTSRVSDFPVDPHDPTGRFHLHYGDRTDCANLFRLIQETRLGEFCNPAARRGVQVRAGTLNSSAGCADTGHIHWYSLPPAAPAVHHR
ncbi:MAG: GDP-mannose 4,6-dehydratase [Hyphomonas sp.]